MLALLVVAAILAGPPPQAHTPSPSPSQSQSPSPSIWMTDNRDGTLEMWVIR